MSIKIVGGVRHMKGTSEGSLIPAVSWDENTGFHLGVRPEMRLSEDGSLLQVGFFARVQFYDKNGDDIEFAYKTAAKFLKHQELRFAGPYHASGNLFGMMIKHPNNEAVDMSVLEAIQEHYRQLATQFAKTHKIWRLQDDVLDAIVQKALEGVLGVEKAATKSPETPTVVHDKEADAKLDELFKDDKLDSAFDFMKMIGQKKDGDDAKKD